MDGTNTVDTVMDAVAQTLRGLEAASGGSLRGVYVNSDALPYDALREKAVRLPAMFVTYKGSRYDTTRYMRLGKVVEFDLTVLCQQGGTGSCGNALDEAAGLLAGSGAMPGVGAATLTRVDVTALKDGTVVQAARFETALDVTPDVWA